MEIKVEQKLLQDTVNYLAKRPYGEVADMIAKLVSSKPVEEEVPTED